MPPPSDQAAVMCVEAGDRVLEGAEVRGRVAGELDGDEDLDVRGDLRQRDLGAVAGG